MPTPSLGNLASRKRPGHAERKQRPAIGTVLPQTKSPPRSPTQDKNKQQRERRREPALVNQIEEEAGRKRGGGARRSRSMRLRTMEARRGVLYILYIVRASGRRGRETLAFPMGCCPRTVFGKNFGSPCGPKPRAELHTPHARPRRRSILAERRTGSAS